MAYFEDLTPYTYLRKEVDPKQLNVGWLSKHQSFPTGEIDPELLDKIGQLVQNPVNLCRGFHDCEFCPPPVYRDREDRAMREIVRDCPHGNGEIRVLGEDGLVYVAPVLIFHYIQEHQYLPPQEFMDAVFSAD